jgi:hypothetical protein
MSFFDDIVDNFSAKDLKSRVRWVVAMGFLLCAAAVVGLYFLLTSVKEISVSGVGRWLPGADGVIEVAVDGSDLRKFANLDKVDIEVTDPAKGPVPAQAPIISLEPSPPAVRVDAEALPADMRNMEKMDVKLVLLKAPLWRILWGK